MSYKNVTHVIFDMDGLLIETESVYNKVVNEIASKYGKKHTTQIRMLTLGTPETDTANILIRELGLPLTIDEFLQVYNEKANKELENPSLMPGAKQFVEHLYKHKVPMAVATSSTEPSMKLKTQNHQELFSKFHHIVCGGTDPDVKHGKPAPDIFLVAASRFPDQPDPAQCIVFEDAPNGVRGARDAGMQGVLVPTEEVDEELKKPATLVLKSLLELKPELFGLPAFES